MKIVEVTYRYDGRTGVVRPRPADADAARRRLDEGSRSIASMLDAAAQGDDVARQIITVDPGDLGLADDAVGAPAQRPYAAVLGCSDARVPIELIFNEGPNDLFVVRVAGNGLGAEGMGSLRYAAGHLGQSLKLVVVLGHSGCGAVSAAVDVFLNPRSYLELAGQHALRNILDRLLVVVHAAAKQLAAAHGSAVAAGPGYRSALIESAVVSNAALSSYTLQHELGGTGAKDLRAAYGVWLLESRMVWAPREGSDSCAGLAFPPADAGGFSGLADAVVRSPRIVSLLEAVPRKKT
jgi:carbonic anhydrase